MAVSLGCGDDLFLSPLCGIFQTKPLGDVLALAVQSKTRTLPPLGTIRRLRSSTSTVSLGNVSGKNQYELDLNLPSDFFRFSNIDLFLPPSQYLNPHPSASR